MIKTYTPKEPPKTGNALKAWNHFVKIRGIPKEMFFAKKYDGDIRNVWVGFYGFVLGPYESGKTDDRTISTRELEVL